MVLSEFLRSAKARWLVPLGVLAVVGAGVGMGSSVAGAAPALAPRTAAELLASVAHATGQPLSGTVVETADLGVPALPGGGGTSLSWQSLITGSHTARVWYASRDQVRVALVGDLAESDVIRDGRDVWVWSSRDFTASHTVLPVGAARPPGATPSIDPLAAATQALAAIDPTTSVRVDGTARVAGRAVYELVLSPRTPSSLIGEIRLAIDSETSVPLRVQVLARGSSTPAFETGFTSISFDRPSDSVFAFTPPAGAKVTETGPLAAHAPAGVTPAVPAGSGAASARPRTIGSGWTTVVELSGVPALDLGTQRSVGGAGSGAAALNALLRTATPVTGSFGTGQLLRTPLLSVLLLPDGRVFAGAVTPDLLEHAASTSPR